MKNSVQISIYLILLLGSDPYLANADSNYIRGTQLPTRETIFEQNLNDQPETVLQPQARKIQYCGTRLLDVIRIMCRHNYNTPESSLNSLVFNGAKSPNEIYIQSPQIRPQRAQMSLPESWIRRSGLIPRRHERQVVKECCIQPCYTSVLLKYCDSLDDLKSSNLELDQVTSAEKINSVLKNSLSGNELSESIIINAVLDGQLNGKVEYLNTILTKMTEGKETFSRSGASPCSHKNKQRRKKHHNKSSPRVYVSIPMVIVPYNENYLPKPLGQSPLDRLSTNTYAAERDNATKFELRGGMNDLVMIYGRENPHERINTFSRKIIRDTHRLPSFPQRALHPTSDEIRDMDYNGLMSNQQVGSQIQTVTDEPYPEPLVVIPSGTNDGFYAH